MWRSIRLYRYNLCYAFCHVTPFKGLNTKLCSYNSKVVRIYENKAPINSIINGINHISVIND